MTSLFHGMKFQSKIHPSSCVVSEPELLHQFEPTMIALLPSPPNNSHQEEQQQDHHQGGGGAEEQEGELHAALRSHGLLRLLQPDPSAASGDFGGLRHITPAALLRPDSPDAVRRCVVLALSSPSLTLAARGNAHSIHGQCLAGASGLSLDLSLLSSVALEGDSVWAGAGALWEDVLRLCLRSCRLAPRSWADYLRLSVGGAISCGGVSGQCSRHGPIACNVSELEVATGRGELVLCSPSRHPDLFYATLGGLGQFGVITRARIPLYPAPDMVRWVRVVYASFEVYAEDAESLLAQPESGRFDYVEGFAFVNGPDPANGWPTVPIRPNQTFDPAQVPQGSGPLLYCLEVALHYRIDEPMAGEAATKKVQGMLSRLRHVRGLEFASDISYEKFLGRVNEDEAAAKANGTWDAPHPWLNLLVSNADIVDFDQRVFKGILKEGIGGPMLVYPLLRSKWKTETSLVVPNATMFYLVALLRFSRPYPDGPPADDLMAQNAQIIDCCVANGYEFKIYLPGFKQESQWRAHFGSEWARFEERKARYDPMGIMCPGQGIFARKAHGPM